MVPGATALLAGLPLVGRPVQGLVLVGARQTAVGSDVTTVEQAVPRIGGKTAVGSAAMTAEPTDRAGAASDETTAREGVLIATMPSVVGALG